MNKFFLISFSPNIYRRREGSEWESDDQMGKRNDYEIVETITSYHVSLKEVIPEKFRIQKFKLLYEEFCSSYRKMNTFCYSDLGVPCVTPRFPIEILKEEIFSFELKPEDIEGFDEIAKIPQKWHFEIHFGGRGWYINAISPYLRSDLTGILHEKFSTYGFKDFYLKNDESLEEVVGEISEFVYEKYAEKPADSRYSKFLS